MGELAAKARSRDLWISRSHVAAALAATLVLSATTFGLGWSLGRSRAPAVAPPLAVEGAGRDDALVELLARVQATAAPDGGVRELTFPDALKGAPGSGELDLGPADPAPPGHFTVVVTTSADRADAQATRDRLVGAGLAAWMRPELVGGKPRWRVAVGGYPTIEAASAGAASVTELGIGRPVAAPL